MDQRKHELYKTFENMRARCTNPKRNRAQIYFGLPICDRWMAPRMGFWNFVEDMGPRPEGHTLDRIDNTKGYSPENCRWASAHRQNVNKKSYSKCGWKYASGPYNGKYRAYYRNYETEKQVYCGVYKTAYEAHLASITHRLENYWRI